jgi:hypothetical protein
MKEKQKIEGPGQTTSWNIGEGRKTQGRNDGIMPTRCVQFHI